jgi:hypothetical protein
MGGKGGPLSTSFLWKRNTIKMLRGNKARQIKDRWVELNLANRVKRIIVYKEKLVDWKGLKEKDAIDLFLKLKGRPVEKRTWAEKKRMIIRMYDKGDSLLTARTIRKPRFRSL